MREIEGIEHIAPFREPIERALAEGYGQMNYRDVLEGIARGEYQFWASKDSCVVSTIDVAIDVHRPAHAADWPVSLDIAPEPPPPRG